MDAGLRDIATPSAFLRDPSKRNMMQSISGFVNVGGAESSKGKRGVGMNRSGRSDIGS